MNYSPKLKIPHIPQKETTMIPTTNFSAPAFKGFKDCVDGDFKFTSFKDDIELINKVQDHAAQGVKETKSIGSKITGLSTDKFTISTEGEGENMTFKVDSGGDTFYISKNSTSTEHCDSDIKNADRLLDTMKSFFEWMQKNV